ncbi:phosphoenolpyruvate carboxylase [Neisseriaceae bacterium ESL0693]|nr:phosphoenolpyruvate carboxylase [Neisseriaceae bacterium ESL0693]
MPDSFATPEIDAVNFINDLLAKMASKNCLLSDLTQELAEKSFSPEGFKTLEEAVHILRDRHFRQRAQALRDYVELAERQSVLEAYLKNVATQLVALAPSPAFLSIPAMAAVFTAHPTFALASEIYSLLAECAESPDQAIPLLPTHRRSSPPTLEEEQQLAVCAIRRGRDALDKLNVYIFEAAAKKWSDLSALTPTPIVLASWVGFDTDGRNDISWFDTFRIRLELKIAQLERLNTGLDNLCLSETALARRVKQALEATIRQQPACRYELQQQTDPAFVADFSRTILSLRQAALLSAEELAPLFDQARLALCADDQQRLDVIRTGFMAHGLGLAHIHTRLNAAQIYNIARTRLGLTDDPRLPAHRRVLLSSIDQAMDKLQPLSVNFGSLLIEPSAAARLMMTMAQILKHIDSKTPIRFLIAETESGYTLLATLWLARLFGIKDEQIEISPLFETETALENGETILREVLRSRHWRDYLRKNGRLSLQFGYSDSGRYVGQIAAGALVERLRLKIIALLKEHDLDGIALTMFDTHGESIGRGAHPFSFRERLKYFSPPRTCKALHDAGISCRFETAFQGADGYVLFGTPALATSTIAIMAQQVVLQHSAGEIAKAPDPLYDQPNFALDFFATIAIKMGDLVNDPGYTALLGAFGPALVDKTGSRPSARQSDSVNITRITHPGQMRAIPNNAILQQLGWWANILHGLGTAANRHQEAFELLKQTSPRFRQLMDFASQALAHSDIDVLRQTMHYLDPGHWLDRAEHSDHDDDKRRFLQIANGLENMEFWKSVPAMFRHLQREHIDLLTAWPDTPRMANEEKLLHVIRFALIERIWRLATDIPYFGPRGSLTREAITTLILCLNIPQALPLLEGLFPITESYIADLEFGEKGEAAIARGFAREHEHIFRPLYDSFELLREVGVAVMHANHSFG